MKMRKVFGVLFLLVLGVGAIANDCWWDYDWASNKYYREAFDIAFISAALPRIVGRPRVLSYGGAPCWNADYPRTGLTINEKRFLYGEKGLITGLVNIDNPVDRKAYVKGWCDGYTVGSWARVLWPPY